MVFSGRGSEAACLLCQITLLVEGKEKEQRLFSFGSRARQEQKWEVSSGISCDFVCFLPRETGRFSIETEIRRASKNKTKRHGSRKAAAVEFLTWGPQARRLFLQPGCADRGCRLHLQQKNMKSTILRQRGKSPVFILNRCVSHVFPRRGWISFALLCRVTFLPATPHAPQETPGTKTDAPSNLALSAGIGNQGPEGAQ